VNVVAQDMDIVIERDACFGLLLSHHQASIVEQEQGIHWVVSTIDQSWQIVGS